MNMLSAVFLAVIFCLQFSKAFSPHPHATSSDPSKPICRLISIHLEVTSCFSHQRLLCGLDLRSFAVNDQHIERAAVISFDRLIHSPTLFIKLLRPAWKVDVRIGAELDGAIDGGIAYAREDSGIWIVDDLEDPLYS